MEQIFKVGDTVYHWSYGYGIVVNIYDEEKLPIKVMFEDTPVYFTIDGKTYNEKHPTLSHTSYDLVNGGFSQRKPLPNIKKGTPVFVRDYDGDIWYLRVFSHFDENGKLHTFPKNSLMGGTIEWNIYSLENPIKYEE